MPEEPIITPGAQPAEQLTQEYHDLEPPAPEEPRAVFKTDLKLTREQEDALCQHVLRRFNELDLELGRSSTAINTDGVPRFFDGSSDATGTRRLKGQRKFMEKRALYQLMMANDYSWRPLLMPKSIFAKSNLVVPLCRRIWKQMVARGHNYFFGTDPWLTVQGIGVEDEALAKAIQLLTETKLRENQNMAMLRRSLMLAFGMGECVLKTTHTENVQYFQRTERVTLAPDGTPLASADGEPIKETDEWIPTEDGPGFSLKRDPATIHPDPSKLQFEDVLLDKENVIYRGPSIRTVYYRDFLCPLDTPDIQAADICFHIMSLGVNELASSYLANPGTDLKSLATAIHALNACLGYDGTSKAAASARPEYGEAEAPTNASEPQIEIAECYVRFDANGDGYQEEIMIVLDLQSGYPITYDYVANVTPDGLRPFRTIVPAPLDGRWCGQGTFEMFERHQEIIDLLINRRSVSQGEAGRVVGWRPENTVQGQNNPALQLNWGGTYALLPNKKWEDTLFVTYLSDNKFQDLTQEMESFIQFAFNESGVQHANDAAVAGMETTKLATGIRNIEASGQEMYGVYISELEAGITAVANAFVTLLYSKLDDQESYLYFDGNIPRELTLASRNVRNLRFNVSVLLSRYKDEQVLASNSQATMLLDNFYAKPPGLQTVLAPMLVKQLTALQIKNAETYVVPQPEPTMPPGNSKQPQMPNNRPKLATPNL